jgi:hypothetical protein
MERRSCDTDRQTHGLRIEFEPRRATLYKLEENVFPLFRYHLLRLF